MVTERQEVPTSEAEPAEHQQLSDAVIVDETDPAVDATSIDVDVGEIVVGEATEEAGAPGAKPEEAAAPGAEPPAVEEPAPAPPRVQDSPEFRAMQAAKDREVAEANRRAQEVQRQAAEQNILAQAEAFKAAQAAGYEQEGYAPEQAVQAAERDKNAALARFQQAVTQQRQQETQVSALAVAVAADNGLSPSDVPALMAQGSQEQMVAHAQALKGGRVRNAARDAEVTALKAEVATLKQARVPAGTPQTELGMAEATAAASGPEALNDRYLAGDRSPEVTAHMDKRMGR